MTKELTAHNLATKLIKAMNNPDMVGAVDMLLVVAKLNMYDIIAKERDDLALKVKDLTAELNVRGV